MATLLHLDSSLYPGDASASRPVTDTFRTAWEEQHPHGTVIYRDLAAHPVPHMAVDAYTAGFVDPAEHSPAQAAAFAPRVQLIEELERADAILSGAPMYNYSIPSTLKAWLDNVILPGRTSGRSASAQGTPVTVVASRGGTYQPGTSREGFEFVQNYLRVVLGDSLGLDVDFIVAELTTVPGNPAKSGLIPQFEASRDRAFADAVAMARALVERLAA
jgi:FMN-dependent NADH-azoreductase